MTLRKSSKRHPLRNRRGRTARDAVRLLCIANRPERPKPSSAQTHGAPAASAAPSLQQQVAQLTSRMLRKKLFMVTYVSKVPPNKLGPLLPDHLEYMTTLARQGVLFAAGPVMHENGAPTGNGMALFNTATAAEARGLAEKDPFYLHGLRDFDVKEWIFMEGSMTVTLNFAESTLGVS
jgi:uncharacterized protein YciI